MPTEIKYPHTQVVSEPNTPLYLKLYTVMIMLRYGVRAGIRFIKKPADGLPPADKLTAERSNEWMERIGDAIVGVLSGTVTTYHMMRTWKDIKSVYSEAVGLELDKNPHQIGLRDLRKSENVLVRNAITRFGWFNTLRYATDLVFFTSLARKEVFGREIPADGTGIDMGMFAKGSLLGFDIVRQPSFFEVLQRLVGSKFGTSGLGNDVTPHELKELYNAYAKKYAPGSLIKATDVELWNNNEAMFKRIAYLINHSYRERRVPFDSSDPRVPGRLVIQKQENFRLPMLLHMMGHGYISLDKTDLTRTYVEIANLHGVKALKQARGMWERGQPLSVIQEQYGVVLPTYIIQHEARSAVEQVAKAPDAPNLPPPPPPILPEEQTHRILVQEAPKSAVERVQAKAAEAAAASAAGRGV